MKFIALLTLLALQGNAIEIENIYKKQWIVGSETLEYFQHTSNMVSLIPKSSKKAQANSMSIKNNSLEFLPNNTIRQYRWRKCGNDSGPNYTEGSWSFNKTQCTLTINGLNNWEGTYKILILDADKLVLSKVK